MYLIKSHENSIFLSAPLRLCLNYPNKLASNYPVTSTAAIAINWLRITHQSEIIQLSWQRGYENPRLAPEVPFQKPFDKENAAKLRWYLEDYLKFPYSIFTSDAVKIEQKLQHWGQQLFELVFRSTEIRYTICLIRGHT